MDIDGVKDVIHSNSCDKIPGSRKRSLTSYAASVFRESSIGMVSTIASTFNKNRKFFKSAILIICLTGFLYQCITFMKVVFEYPTSIHIDVKRPEQFTVPAYSFCSNNGVKRSVYCKVYPNHCTESNETFCEAFYPYCGKKKNTLVPKKEYLNIEHSMTYEEMLSIGDDLDDFLRQNKNPFNETPSGPYLRSKDLEFGGMFCYSLHSVVNSSNYPLNVKKQPLFKEPSNELTFYVEEDEMFTPGSRAGVLFSIHSPYEAVNPFENGIYMKPGRQYKIYVDMTEEMLLQQPYDTDCINYLEQWETNNRTGPRIQEMCKHKCLLETSLKCYGCKMPLLLYPSHEKICTRDEWFKKPCSEEYLDKKERCYADCKDDCKRTKYSLRIEERYDVKYASMIKPRRLDNQSIEGDVMENYNRYIFVQIYLESGEVMTLKHSPKYMDHLIAYLAKATDIWNEKPMCIKQKNFLQSHFFIFISLLNIIFIFSCLRQTVEVFSAIGGFIGVWLGISLMDIADLFENFYRIIGYFFTRK